MKKKLFTIFIFLSSFSLSNELFGQDFISHAATKEAAASGLKNSTVTINNQTFDYRILKHYSEADLRSMSDVKRKQIHFIYTESYHVIDMANCPTLMESDIDVSKLEVFRKEDSSNTVLYGKDCKVSVVLMSRNEMQELMDILKN